MNLYNIKNQNFVLLVTLKNVIYVKLKYRDNKGGNNILLMINVIKIKGNIDYIKNSIFKLILQNLVSTA